MIRKFDCDLDSTEFEPRFHNSWSMEFRNETNAARQMSDVGKISDSLRSISEEGFKVSLRKMPPSEPSSYQSS
jgi:hypothetical protein